MAPPIIRGSTAHITLTTPLEVFADDPKSLQGPDVRDGIAALVTRTEGRVLWAWLPLVVRQGSVRLQSMAGREK